MGGGGGYQTRGPRMELYYKFVSGLIKRFNEVIIEQVPRADNAGADALAKMGSQRGHYARGHTSQNSNEA